MEESLFGTSHVILFLCTILAITQTINSQPVAEVGNSQIVGSKVVADGKPVNQFLSIPYAQPPTGNLRFKKPVPLQSLPSKYRAINTPSACWQHSEYPFPWYDSSPGKDEDCLYLNIWTPDEASPQNKKAVIFFIHGGGFRYGSIRQMIYNGAPLAALGDVVVVTVNYRLGSLGFLTTGTEEAPGNVGLYDILEALKWVNQNIEAFGGDSSKITLAGQGAGAVAVGLLSTSPLAKGLYQRQIMESGSPARPYSHSKRANLKMSQKVAERVNCANQTYTLQQNPTQVLSCLRKTPPEKLSEATATVKPLSNVNFLPQYGDDLLPVNPHTAIKNQNIMCNDILIGNTLDEGSYQLTTQYPDLFGFFGEKEPVISKSTGENLIRDSFKNFPNQNLLVQQYLPSSVSNRSYEVIREHVYAASGDVSVVCPTIYYAEKCASGGGSVYYYVFRRRPTTSPWAYWMGATHFSEIEFVFGIPVIRPNYFQPDEVQISMSMIQIWSTFARNGKPGIYWPMFSPEKPELKYLGPGLSTSKNDLGFHQDQCNFFRPYFGF
ncbi:acetylcholinesterase-1 [Trichonephila clavipes]|nr:acetylcholinesterase-1 [Trichonephila clavipes]